MSEGTLALTIIAVLAATYTAVITLTIRHRIRSRRMRKTSERLNRENIE